MTLEEYDTWVEPAVARLSAELVPKDNYQINLSMYLMKVPGKARDTWGLWVSGELPMTDRDKRLLTMLASPHWQTLLKALQAQGEIPHDL